MTRTDRRRITAAAIITAFLLGLAFPWDAMPWAPPASITTDDTEGTPTP